jgi:hypothetical protein
MSTSRAEHTTSYRGRATTSFISDHQLKTWSLLSKDNQSKSWEKVWENKNCLSLVTSHVVGTSRAEHTTSYMSYKQMKTLSLFTTSQPIQVLKKVWPLFFLSLITSHAISTSRAEHTTSYVMPPNWNGLLFLVASIGTSRAEHTTFYMPYQHIETFLWLTTRQFLQWKFICHWYLKTINRDLGKRWEFSVSSK